MSRLSSAVFSVITLSLMLVTGCSSMAKLNGSWRDNTYAGDSRGRVLVVGVFKAVEARQAFESEFVRQLRSRGIDAVPSFGAFPDIAVFSKDRVKELVPKVAEMQISSALITYLVDARQRQVEIGWSNVYSYDQGFWDYLSVAYGEMTGEGYGINYDVYSLRSGLYDMQAQRMVWGALAEVWDPYPISKAANQLVTAMVEQLAKDKIYTMQPVRSPATTTDKVKPDQP